MADTTTTNLGLVKPEVGASTDTWGTKVNNDLDAVDALFDAGPVLKVTKGGTGAANAADARTALGLAIGTDVQAYDATIVVDADIGVSVQAYDANNTTATNTQTLTNKTLTAPAITAPVMTGDIYANGSVRGNVTAMGALDIDCSAGNYFTKTINGSSTFTFSNVPAGSYAFTLELTVTSGAVTYPASVKWFADTAPVFTNGKTSLLMFVTDDGGTRWRGAALVDYTT